MVLDSAAFGAGLAGTFLVLGLAAWLVKSFIARARRVRRPTSEAPASAPGVALRYARSDELELARHSLHTLLRGCIELLEPVAHEKGLTLELSLAPELPDGVELDAGRLHRVLVDLIHGSLQLTETGGVKVHADAVDETSERFGLRARVEDSRAGAGSRFQLVIPIVRKQAQRSAARSSLPPPPVPWHLPSPTAPILVVDDEVVDRIGALELLETLGFQAELATGGEHAMELVSLGKYSLILMDCEMPELDGYMAARRIRELATSPHLPIIGCTAASSTEQRKKALDAGMEDCLKKPLERADLCRVLSMYLPDDKTPASSGTRVISAAARTLRPHGAPQGEPPDLVPRHRSERLVDLFVTQVPEELHELAVAADLGRPDELARRALQLERTCLGCGAMKMAAACAALKNARGLSQEQLSARLKTLNDAFLVVMRLLGETSPTSENASAPASQRNPEPP